MGLGFGYNSWVGLGVENTYGNAVSATYFFEVLCIKNALGVSEIPKPSLRGVSSQYPASTKSKANPTCGFKANMGWEGFEVLLWQALGSYSASGSAPTTHAFTLTSALPTGLTIVINPDAGSLGGNTAWQFSGCQIDKLVITQAVEGLLEVEVDFVAQAFTQIALPSPSFTTFVPIDWLMKSTSDTLSTAVGIKLDMIEISINNGLASGRYQLGQQTRKGLGRDKNREVTLKIGGEFDSVTLLTAYAALTALSGKVTTWSYATSSRSLSFTFGTLVAKTGDPSIAKSGPIPITAEFQSFATAAGNDEVAISLANVTGALG